MKKVLTIVVLPIIAIVIGYLIYTSIQEPVIFEKERRFREKIGIERLKDIRTLQVAYKSKHKASSDQIKNNDIPEKRK